MLILTANLFYKQETKQQSNGTLTVIHKGGGSLERIKRVSVLLWAAVLLFTGCGIGNDTNNTDVEGVPKEA